MPEGKATSLNVDNLLRQFLLVKIFRIGAKSTCADYPQLVYILLISIEILVATDFSESGVLSKPRKIFMVKWYAKSD